MNPRCAVKKKVPVPNTATTNADNLYFHIIFLIFPFRNERSSSESGLNIYNSLQGTNISLKNY